MRSQLSMQLMIVLQRSGKMLEIYIRHLIIIPQLQILTKTKLDLQ